ncbi:hypothetical protein D3C81_1778780 [compost metagenome]
MQTQRWQRQHRARANLDQRQGQWNQPPQHPGHDDQRQQDEDGISGLHKAAFLSVQQAANSIQAKVRH